MKFLVFSDSHGYIVSMEEVIRRHLPKETSGSGDLPKNLPVILHLGDLGKDTVTMKKIFPQLNFISVRGNCDAIETNESMYADINTESAEKIRQIYNISVKFEQNYSGAVIEAGGIRLFLTHGHRYEVSYSLEKIKKAAQARSADAVLFGHTHIPLDRYEKRETAGKVQNEKTVSQSKNNDGIYFFNPGSISLPRGGPRSWGVIEIQSGQILLSHGKMTY